MEPATTSQGSDKNAAVLFTVADAVAVQLGCHMHSKKTSNITYGISRDLTNKNKDSAIKIGETNKYEIQWIDVRQILQESRVSEPKM
jgi:hypothetical protein